MSILAWIVVGIIAGWLAERITGRNHGLLTNLIVGIVGAFLGGFIFSSLLGFRYEEGFNLPSIVVATVGAVVLLAVTGGFRQRQPLRGSWHLVRRSRRSHLRGPDREDAACMARTAFLPVGRRRGLDAIIGLV